MEGIIGTGKRKNARQESVKSQNPRESAIQTKKNAPGLYDPERFAY
jgi:hypothetical protein